MYTMVKHIKHKMEQQVPILETVAKNSESKHVVVNICLNDLSIKIPQTLKT